MIIGSCAKLILLLTCIVAVLQVIHLVLLNHLEVLRSQRKKLFQEQKVQILSPDEQAKLIYEQLESFVENKHFLDSTGVYRIVNFADVLKPVVFSAPIPDITLVTHCSFNHLHKLVPLSKRWQGAISISIYTEVDQIPATLWKIASMQVYFPGLKDNVTYSLVSPVPSKSDSVPTVPPFTALDISNNSEEYAQNYALPRSYPNNLLRNVARRATYTEFILAIDIDMMPSENLRQEFLMFANKKGLFKKNRRYYKSVFVIPTFEAKETVSPPLNKAQLLSLIETGEIRPFYAQICPKCQDEKVSNEESLAAAETLLAYLKRDKMTKDLTNYEAWLNEPSGSEMAPLYDVIWKDPWEPFYIASNNVPLFDERFKQYGFNRISQVCELHVAGYTFSVMNNGFVVHHGFKTDSSFHSEKDEEQEANRLLFRQFKAELKYKYIDSSRRCY